MQLTDGIPPSQNDVWAYLDYWYAPREKTFFDTTVENGDVCAESHT